LRTAEYETRTLGGVRGALRSYLGAEPSTRLAAFYFVRSAISISISLHKSSKS
jgi:hypothetical protein